MADYHSVYQGPEGQTTQWDDIQRKMGNLPAKEPVKKADPWTPEREESKNKDWVDSKAADELEELEDEFDDNRFLEQYRLHSLLCWFCSTCSLWVHLRISCSDACNRRHHTYCLHRQERIEQLKAAQKQARFGSMEQITRGDFVQQVTNAGEDVYVVVHLYKDK